MSYKKDKNLFLESSIIRGTFFGVVGVGINIISSFVTGLLLARDLGARGLGSWKLSLLIINLAIMITSLGLNQGVTRFVGIYRGGNKLKKVAETITIAFIITAVSSITISIIVYFFSFSIASFFKDYKIHNILKIICWSIPPLIITNVLLAVFRGFEDIKTVTMINSILKGGLWFIVICLLTFIGLNLKNISFGFLVTSFAITLYAIFLFNRHYSGKIFLMFYKTNRPSINNVYSLLSFSIPLLFSSFLDFVKTQTDTFMLGYFLTSREVGIYDVAFRIAQLSPFLLTSIIGIYVPVISSSIGYGDYQQVKDIYFRVTKWSLLPTLLIIATLITFSDFFLKIFGHEFSEADTALRILLLTYLIHALTGPNGATLVALGETKFIAFYTFLGAFSNVILNWFMIPKYSVNGAAFASLISVTIMNLLASSRLYFRYSITPFLKEYNCFVFTCLILSLLLGKFMSYLMSSLIGVFCFMLILGLLELLFLKFYDLIDKKDKILLKKIMDKIEAFSIK